MKKGFLIMVITVVVVLIFVGINYQNKKVRKEFNLFYSSHLSGRIIKIDKYSRNSNFILDNNSAEFAFNPYLDKELNNSEIFQYIAKPGDSIYKPAHSDTLLLIKGDKNYYYTFQKKDN
ncbi:hypothetical protein [Flavobacterium microcysteis]